MPKYDDALYISSGEYLERAMSHLASIWDIQEVYRMTVFTLHANDANNHTRGIVVPLHQKIMAPFVPLPST